MLTTSLIRSLRRLAVATAVAASLASPAWASDAGLLPAAGPVRIIVPLTAGGVADTSSRNLAGELGKILNRPVIVENKPGGLFTIGMRALHAAPPDGLTLLYLYNSLASVQVVQKQFDLTRDLLPLTQTTVTPMVLLVPGNSPFRSLKDLVAFARQHPGKLNYSSLGVGSTEHLKAVQFGRIAGFDAANVPYKSGPDMMTDLIAGRVDFTMTAATFASMYVPKGQVRALAVVDDKRMPDMPDVPTVAEAGYRVPPLVLWGGYGIRADTPPAVAQAMRQAVAKAAMAPQVRESLATFSIHPAISSSSRDFKQLIEADLVWMGEAAKGLKLDAN
ncbi:tripartite tricarboxylate transporter substrate binding protein [Pigmentiphaga sp. H8]|uniref:tripartite tricarboxylate transporter substrate binding protein n=1 Tax=unclassified Pigmentiphaga TaxID=2626614 RepID=UPI000F59772A|nr:tripartite tricarboxylate transporter substrate binding protein [Pigmentiphaga sp. H8]AZG10963.1 tripartite tricarboxylate transporter substrate binding protein [Pigmentiphaga sp. H8]